MNTNEILTETNSKTQFPVVAIATAANEIDVLKNMLSDLPPDSGMAYLIFQDLSLNQSDNLAEAISANSKIPVIEIIQQIDIKPNNIYIIPENNFLILENGILKLKSRNRSSKVNNCLDIYFEAVGQTFQSYAVGLMLTWTSFDGSAGLKKLKENGGSTIAVVSKNGFIQNAVTSEYIDYFVSPGDITEKLVQIHESKLATHSYEEKENTAAEKKLFDEIISILFQKTGTNFQHYKDTTLRRRIAKRMVVTKQETTEMYLKFLKNNTIEQDLLFNDILIPVTYFFRDQKAFDNLCGNTFPSLIDSLKTDVIRVWCAGCSTGEEAYSIAICIHDYLEETNRTNIKVQIIASDLSQKCIANARAGNYTAQDVKNISETRLEKYFTKRDNSFHVNKIIRDMCVFAVHDLTKDTPFAKIDFISCRNVLIYFDTELQNQVLSSFHYALRDQGILFLGKSEWAQNVPHLFTAIDQTDKIYTRKTFLQLHQKEIYTTTNTVKHITKGIEQSIPDEKDYRKIASDILLEQFSPAAVIINEDLEIIHFHGDTSPFLQPASGKPSFNILNMVRDELEFELRNYILKARNEKKNYSGEFTEVKKQPFLTSFEVIYLPNHTELLLIIFCKKNNIPAKNEQIGASNPDHTQQIEKELTQLRGDFKRVTEEQQLYFEELQTSNEELLSSTEELQIINYQLESLTIELLSNNEELSCINDELKDRREELALMRNFYESIVKTIREPLLIIDKNFIIKSANPSFYNYFKTTEEKTEGLSVLEIGNSHWNVPAFKESILKKTSRNEIVENFKIQFDFDVIGKKTILINASPIVNSTPNGMILLAIEDSTDLEQSNESLKIKNLELQAYNQQLESFTFAASESLLEPIRKIYMFGKKVLDGEKILTETSRHNLSRLLSSAVNMNQLIEDVIDYSKINFGRKDLKKTDLNILLKKIINDLKTPKTGQKPLIKINALPTLYIIPSQMHQLFTHLISNSIKYAKQTAAPEITIGIENVSAEELIDFGADPSINYVKLFVSDNGIGFSKNFETLIFNPFYKLHSNDQQYGSGLGLTLVQKIVYNHKGFIKVSSEPSKGTIVFIYLPA
ncbi:two-component system CheB/CheR fusion protein [Flavobacterium sp. HSC-32F16]|uniref:CheR family methyltransferase n=1 Tax=Flavobacterium sp. HSC-32F16 TaxID=2910964 RepID=UPI0020A391D3|nr:CheR family methyltransferase [Flavobacterium sp. HSC-32F16]MCP2025273.1 two-component system CheB/CheR fusion protein [Flavobacterium sp. HSC-32F16]